MTREEIRAAILEELAEIAPDAAETELPGDADLRETLDLDSMDILNPMTALHERLGIAIPDRDQRQLTTLDGAVAYLAGRLAAS
jgi:acyl carrier protein